MTFLIDAHEDLAYSALTFKRDYRQSAYETRKIEAGSHTVDVNGDCMLGWPEYQKGQVAVIVCSLFISPRKYREGTWENQDYASFDEAYRLTMGQVDYYRRLCDSAPDKFRQLLDRADLAQVLQPWNEASVSSATPANPVGLVLSVEGAEGISSQHQLEELWQAGVRYIGPVWAGTRLCGGTLEGDGFTREGLIFLDWMAELGYTLDIAHMNERSALEALDRFPGRIIASHANASALLDGDERLIRRHLSDRVIRSLSERGGVMGVLPCNRFLVPGWEPGDSREQVPLRLLVDHVDHICQVAGSSRHVAIGSDFDGGFGWPTVPLEFDSIADLQKIEPALLARGFEPADIQAIFHQNWQNILENTLPA